MFALRAVTQYHLTANKTSCRDCGKFRRVLNQV